MINEYDQIRKSLAVIRTLKEDITRGDQMIDLSQSNDDTAESNDETPSGEKITFDDINTIGFLNSQSSLSDQIKSEITTNVGTFLKATGLLLDTVTINVEDSRIILSSETIKNPSVDMIKTIRFDTDSENPQMDVITGTIDLDNDTINLLQTISSTYNDNQIGRNKLISITQGNSGEL
jgi:hypothetical protein